MPVLDDLAKQTRKVAVPLLFRSLYEPVPAFQKIIEEYKRRCDALPWYKKAYRRIRNRLLNLGRCKCDD